MRKELDFYAQRIGLLCELKLGSSLYAQSEVHHGQEAPICVLMGGMPANHCIEIDEGAAQWSSDADACVDCKSESMRSFHLLVNDDNRFAVYVWWLRSDPSPKAGTRQLTARKLVGVAAVSQDRDQSRENAPAVSPGVGFNIHGLGVNEVDEDTR